METEHWSEDDEQNEKLIPDNVLKLRNILEEKHNIIVPAHCDEFIARCIRMKDGDLENAIKLVNAYLIASTNLPEWDAKFEPSRSKEEYKSALGMVISQRDSKSRIICVGRVGMWNPDTVTFDQSIALDWMLFQFITAKFKDTQRNGFVTIWDFSGYSMKHVWAVNNRRIPYLARVVQNGVVGRMKEFHVINHPRILSIVYKTIIKPFLKEKIKKRIIFHDNLESLHAHFDKTRLPTFAGGDKEFEECIDQNLMDEFFRQDEYFKDMMNDRFPRY